MKRFKSKTPESRNEEEFHAKLQDINDLKSSQSKHRETLKDIKSSMRRDLTLMPKVMEKLEVDVPEETRQTTEGKSFKILKSETMGMRRTGSNFDLKDDRNLLKHQFSMQKDKPINKRITREQINNIYRRIVNHDIFQYNKGLNLRYFFKCLCLRGDKSVKNLSKSDFYLNKGVNKLNRDMDIIDFVRMGHYVYIMR